MANLGKGLGDRPELALLVGLAEVPQDGTRRPEADPVARAQRDLLVDGTVVDERAVPAAVAEDVGAAVVDHLAVPRRDGAVLLAVEDKVASRLSAEGKRRAA